MRVEERGWSVSGVECFRSGARELTRGTLNRRGKAVATWEDPADGSNGRLAFRRSTEESAFRKAAEADPRAGSGEFCPKAELVVWEMAAEHISNAMLRSWCSESVVLKAPGSGPREYVRCKVAWDPSDPALEKRILAKWPGAEIVNRRFDTRCSTKSSAKKGAVPLA